MLNPSVIVKTNSIIEGSGLIADRPIPAGEILFKFDDTKPPVHQYEVPHWPPQKRTRFLAFASQIGEDDFSFQQGDIKYINHSCDPTGWWSSYGTLTARRDIKTGEEITYDYPTADISLIYQIECLCGANSCRGTVTNKDYLDSEFQRKYANHLPAHVVEAIRKANYGNSALQNAHTEPTPDHVTSTVNQVIRNSLDFQEKYGEQYIYEMVKLAIQKIKSNAPEYYTNHGDRFIFELVRKLILNL